MSCSTYGSFRDSDSGLNKNSINGVDNTIDDGSMIMGEEVVLVSIVMATFNDKLDYLEQSITSILQQTYKKFELIIVDDSTDEACKLFLQNVASKDVRIKLLQTTEKLGFVRSLNKGIETSKGRYIARMDSDDESYPNRLYKQVCWLENHLDVDILGGDIDIMDDDGLISGRRKYLNKYQDICRNAYFRNPIAHPTVMYRKDAIMQLNGYDEEFIMAEDYELWLRALKHGFVINNLPDTLLKYRICNDYYRKRNKKNWKYNMLAKWHNRTFSQGCLLGLMFSAGMYICPQFIMKQLYEKDRNIKEGQ